MSVPNQDHTTHTMQHLLDGQFNHNCEECWHEPVSAFEKVDIFSMLLDLQNAEAKFYKSTK